MTPRRRRREERGFSEDYPGSGVGYNQCYTGPMKTAVSIPDRVFESAERLAARLGISRSELYARALATLIEKHREDVITERLNEIYGPGGEPSSIDREVAIVQGLSLGREKW